MRSASFVLRSTSCRAVSGQSDYDCVLGLVCVRTVYLVDIWNMIEAFREAGLSSLDCVDEVPLTLLEVLLNCVFSSLNKRLPNSAQIDITESVHSLFSFLVCAYDVYVFCHCFHLI